jgi:hypothetical protein
MAEPPRLPAILLPWEKSIVYFVTICVKDRRNVLARPEILRHGLVQRAEDWLYYLDFNNELDPESYQLPLQGNQVQFRGIGGR